VPALGRQPQGGVLRAHERAHPAQQYVREAAVGALLPDGEGQLVDVGQRPVLPEELGERPHHQAERPDQHGQQNGSPRRRVQGKQENQPDGDVDGGQDLRR